MGMPFKFRDFILFAIIVLLCGLSVTLFLRNQLLEKNYKTLVEETAKTKTKLDELEKESQANKALVTQLEKEKGDLQGSLESMKKEFEAVQAAVQKAGEELKTAKEEKNYLEEMLINKTKEADEYKSRAASSVPEPSPASLSEGPSDEALRAQIRQKDNEIAGLTEENKALSEKLDKIYQTASAKISEINSARSSLDRSVETARQKVTEDYGSAVNLGAIDVDAPSRTESLSRAERSPQVEAPLRPEPAPEVKPQAVRGGSVSEPALSSPLTAKEQRKEGRVLVVNKQHGFVIINMGLADGITPATTFKVIKDRDSVAKLGVLEIQDVMTACVVKDIRRGEDIMVNDTVAVEGPTL